MNLALRAFGITILAASFPAITTSGAMATAAPKTENLDSLGVAQSNEEVSDGLIAVANAAERDDSGTLLSVTWSVENEGNTEVYFDWPTGPSYTYTNIAFSGVTAVTQEGGTRFHPIMDGQGACLCSGVSSIDFKENIGPGEQVAYWSMYSVPEDVDAITLEIPGFEPIEDIPIS